MGGKKTSASDPLAEVFLLQYSISRSVTQGTP